MQGVGRVDRIKLAIFLFFIAAITLVALGGARSSAHDNDKDKPARPADSKADAATTPNTAAPATIPGATSNLTQEKTVAAAEGCVSCHNNIEPMHVTPSGKIEGGKDGQGLTCTYCHGGNPAAKLKEEAHVRPRNPDVWKTGGTRTSANPERTNAALNGESWEFVRFINPADLRVTAKMCAECHSAEVAANDNSMMRHGAMLWGAALYNNGGFPLKDARFGEAYADESGAPLRLIQVPQPTKEEQLLKGWLPFLDPLPRWEISQPGNILRVFERGGKRRLEVGLPDRDEDPGKPDKGLSARGLGTLQRTDPVYLGIQKTRLLDPTLNHL
ncbi:MAG TPA: cytochrome c3 family protein, partial [Pyrinomonadaceae bacterium]|nr:cytochrome c3 family protein [Pyrinomonadaceae bacterium]